MKRTALVRKTPLRAATQLTRSLPVHPRRVSREPRTTPRPSEGRSARKRASDAELRRIVPLLKERAAGRCEITDVPLGPGEGHAHHRLKRSGPERDTLENLFWISGALHISFVHAKPALSQRFGWILRSWQDPATTPVYRRGRWVFLLPDGGIDPAPNPHDEGIL